MKQGGVFHGGALDRAIARFGGAREEWLDLSTGINPVPYPVAEIAADSWTRLPEEGALRRLVETARAAYRVANGFEVVAAPGTQALIEALPRVLPGKTATIVAPSAGTYREHAHCCRKAGRQVDYVSTLDAAGEEPCLVILVNPNNPDGHVRPRREISDLAARLCSRGGTVVVDEAFCDVAPEASIVADAPENVVALRSFGKFFGLAGLRLGFAVAAPALAEILRDWFGPWAVSGPALAIGAKALEDTAWIAATCERLDRQSREMAETLQGLGFAIAGRNGLFVLVRHERAADIAEKLGNERILVRPFADKPTLLRFGLCARNEEYQRLKSVLCSLMRAVG